LAGGLGTRLKPITEKIPKAMAEINGKPFLFYFLNMLKKRGFVRILLLVGHFGECIKGYLKNGDEFGLSVSYSTEDKLLGTGGAIKKAEDKIDSEFLLINGDTYLDFNYSDFIDTFKRINKKGLLCVFPNKNFEFKNNILIDDSNRIIGYNKDKLGGLNGVDAGVAIFKKEVLKLIRFDEKISLEESVYQNLIEEGQLSAYLTRNKFLDIGSFSMLRKAKKVLK
jgi:NDP-sugar pyrophosphorylase family protein